MAEFLRYELKEFDTATLSGTYQNYGSALARAAKGAEFTNTSTVDAYITIDGTNAALRVAAGKTVSVPSYLQSDSGSGGTYAFQKGTQLKVKQVTAAAAGALIGHIYT